MQYVCIWSQYPQYTMLLCDGVAHVEGDERLPEIPKINQVNMFQSKEHSVFQKVILLIRGKWSPLLLKQFYVLPTCPKLQDSIPM